MNHIPQKLYKFLKRHKVYFQIQVHPQTFTSCETAQEAHVCGKKLIKAVMVKVDGENAMVVIPSNRTVDLLKLSNVLGTLDVRIADEQDFDGLFPQCEPGALPPFGCLYGMPCYVDESIGDELEVVFSAGTHSETMTVGTADYLRVAKAKRGDFSVLGKKVLTS